MFIAWLICSPPCFGNDTPNSFWRVISLSLWASWWAGRSRCLVVCDPRAWPIDASLLDDPLGRADGKPSWCLFPEQLHLIKFLTPVPSIANLSLLEPSLLCTTVLGAARGPSHTSSCCLSAWPFDSSEGTLFMSAWPCNVLESLHLCFLVMGGGEELRRGW